MSASAVLLVLAASFGHALWNARTHSVRPPRHARRLVLRRCALVDPWIVLDPPFEVWWLLLTSGLLHASYITALAAAYDRGRSPSRTVARGSAPLVVAALGIWLLDQVPTPFTVVGAVLVAIGLVMIGNVGWNTGQRSRSRWRCDRCVIGGYTLVDAAVEDVDGWAFFAMSSYLGATFAIIGNRLPIERLRASLRSGVPSSCLVDELCAHPVGLHPRRRSERGDAPLDLDPLRAALVRGH